MNRRLFFLNQDGWFEAEVTAKLLNSSNEELLQWTYAIMDKLGYRNYLITENPGIILGNRNSTISSHKIPDTRYCDRATG
jgi:hypothetical protein